MSSVGFPEGLELYAPIELSFCRFVVSSGRPFIVEDARHDPRTIGDPAIEAFAAFRGRFPVRGFGHQMSAPLAVMFNSR